MFLAVAVLLIHPQIGATASLSALNGAMRDPAAVAVADSSLNAGDSPAPDAIPVEPGTDAAAQPAGETIGALPEAPVPIEPGLTAPAPIAFIKPAKPMTVSVTELRAENRRNQMLWRGLAIATSGAATFDAWTTRHAISTTGAVELNPMLRPFAGNGSLYAAIQVAPVLLDFAGKKMMYSRHYLVRHAWWVPQSASFVSSMFCGAHNLAFH